MLKNKSKSAFTLIEMLISISILMIFLGIVAGSYTTLVSANRKANDAQKLYRDARFVFDILAAELHNGTLDYSCLDATNGMDPLCLENQTGDKQTMLAVTHDKGKSRSVFKFDASDKKIKVLHQARTAAGWDGGEFENLTSDKFPLEDFSFSAFPLKNPYESLNAGDDDVQFQPAVTIAMKVGDLNLRTTYSSRTYGKQSIYAQ